MTYKLFLHISLNDLLDASTLQEFCNYDDYNWDWSLQYIGKENIVGRLPTMIVKTPRVYHIGDWYVFYLLINIL